MQVCRHCFGESTRLDDEFRTGESVKNCPSCNASNVLVRDATELAHLFEPLKNFYHIAEEGHDYVYGSEDKCSLFASNCDDLLSHLQNDWQLFSDDMGEEKQREVLGELWGDWDDLDEYSSECIYEAWADEIWDSISKNLKHRWRFFTLTNKEANTLYGFNIERDLAHYIESCKQSHHTDDLIRARIGEHSRKEMGLHLPRSSRRAGERIRLVSHIYTLQLTRSLRLLK